MQLLHYPGLSTLKIIIIAVLLLACCLSPNRSTIANMEKSNDTFPSSQEQQFKDHRYERIPIPGYSGPEFRLSQDYPSTRPTNEPRPWEAFSFMTQSEQYLMSVLAYAMEGNLEVGWAGQNNSVRKWYHVPWLDAGANGREFIHGLTLERASRPRELHPSQTSFWGNYAVGLYNPVGGYIVGKVWEDHDNPDAAAARFPNGTVAVKLLFTTASVTEVPYLKGAFEWDAYVRTRGSQPLAIQKVRLLQIDVAVRDTRANSTTGWVFGTFQYDGNAPGRTPWEKMKPVGLMWGNDPTLTQARYVQGRRPVQSKIINRVIGGAQQHLGHNERLNGPVDNSASSCLSCHSTASDPNFQPSVPPTQINGQPITDAQRMRWFRNIRSGHSFDPERTSLDYSLQLSEGIRRFRLANEPPRN